MSRRPNIEEALKKVSSRYELVHAAAKRVKQLGEFVGLNIKRLTHFRKLLGRHTLI